MGIRTVFNILGPLTNPARAQHQVIGVADGSIGEKMARVLQLMGSKHALVVHGEDGLDEISLSSPSRMWELKDGRIEAYTISAEEVGMRSGEGVSIIGGSPQASSAILRDVLEGKDGPARDVVLLNAAAALVAADKAVGLKEGVELAARSIDSDDARKKLEALIRVSQALS